MSVHNAPRYPWSPADDERLIKMRLAGVTFLEIGKVFGVSKGSVERRVGRLRDQGRLPMPSAPAAAPEPVSEPKRTSGCNRIAPHLVGFERARRGFDLPHHKRDQYFALLTAGVPIAEAKRKLRLGEGVGAS